MGRLADLATRALLPSAGVWAVNVLVGRALRSVDETPAVRALQARRTPTRDRVAKVVSTTSDVPASVAIATLSIPALLAVRKPWPVAIMPALAMGLETWSYVAAGAVVNRERPAVERLDRDQPTSSFPSGHVGATVALMVVCWRLAADLPVPARRLVRALCAAYPTALAPSRVYVGMHFPTDVAAGVVNGLACGALALHWTKED